MSVYDNLAFPLRNRGVPETDVDIRVKQIAEMLEVSEMLSQGAAGLSPDNKQKISMGRGLVRDDVNVVMFDEPLTVIDPHLKWKLRSKLKELHQRIKATMIYVTHDQTEALTFADQVVVMQDGEVVQIGTPIELFERPTHTFVGHFIGSPGMNVLPCDVKGGSAFFHGQQVELEGDIVKGADGKTEIGVRPEDVGRHNVVEAMAGDQKVAAIVKDEVPNQGDLVFLDFKTDQTRLYADGWLATNAQGAAK